VKSGVKFNDNISHTVTLAVCGDTETRYAAVVHDDHILCLSPGMHKLSKYLQPTPEF